MNFNLNSSLFWGAALFGGPAAVLSGKEQKG